MQRPVFVYHLAEEMLMKNPFDIELRAVRELWYKKDNDGEEAIVPIRNRRSRQDHIGAEEPLRIRLIGGRRIQGRRDPISSNTVREESDLILVEKTGQTLRIFEPYDRQHRRTRMRSQDPDVDSDGEEILYGHSGTEKKFPRWIVCTKCGTTGRNNERNDQGTSFVTTKYYCNACSVHVCYPQRLHNMDIQGRVFCCWNELHQVNISVEKFKSHKLRKRLQS